jgi:hypothetical protein
MRMQLEVTALEIRFILQVWFFYELKYHEFWANHMQGMLVEDFRK